MCTVSILLFAFDKGMMLRTKILHCTAVPNNWHSWKVFSVCWNLSLLGCQSTALFFAIICQRKFSQCFIGRAKTCTCHKIELLILFDSMTNDKKFYNLKNPHSLHIHHVKKSLISKDNYLFSLMIHIFCFFDLFLGRFLTPCVFVQSKINLSYLKTFV